MYRLALVPLFLVPRLAFALDCSDLLELRRRGAAHDALLAHAAADGQDRAWVDRCLAEDNARRAAEAAMEEARREAERRAAAEAMARRARAEEARSQAERQAAEAAGSMASMASAAPAGPRTQHPALEVPRPRERYTDHGVGEPVDTRVDPVSTFSVDVDTASYAIARGKLSRGRLPPPAAVRVEEFVNAFDYTYRTPTDAPFAIDTVVAPHPFSADRQIVRIGLQGRALRGARRPVHLTFLVDVSGSMESPTKIGLARRALHHLVDQLGPEDTVAVVTYAGQTRIALPPTPTTRRERLHHAIDTLATGGGTAMASGMELAYQLASDSFLDGCENRVIVLSDGDANIGGTTHHDVLEAIADHAERGITLTTIGLGSGNYHDSLMEQLADRGDGNYHYLDSLHEAHKVFGEQLAGTIETIARDVKVQVHFDPASVERYRLLGYENRGLADRDFEDDAVDAGDVGSGHTVTALYEVELRSDAGSRSLGQVHLRAKPAHGQGPVRTLSARLSRAASDDPFEAADLDTRLAFTVATFAEKLRRSPHVEGVRWSQVLALAKQVDQGTQATTELVELIERAGQLDRRSDLAKR